MDHTGHNQLPRSPAAVGAARAVWERWLDAYGPAIACALEEQRRYRLLRIGSAELAFSNSATYAAALRSGWDAGFAPEPLGWARGSELPELAPRLAAVDPNLADMPPSDVAGEPRRFPPR